MVLSGCGHTRRASARRLATSGSEMGDQRAFHFIEGLLSCWLPHIRRRKGEPTPLLIDEIVQLLQHIGSFHRFAVHWWQDTIRLPNRQEAQDLIPMLPRDSAFALDAWHGNS